MHLSVFTDVLVLVLVLPPWESTTIGKGCKRMYGSILSGEKQSANLLLVNRKGLSQPHRHNEMVDEEIIKFR